MTDFTFTDDMASITGRYDESELRARKWVSACLAWAHESAENTQLAHHILRHTGYLTAFYSISLAANVPAPTAASYDSTDIQDQFMCLGAINDVLEHGWYSYCIASREKHMKVGYATQLFELPSILAMYFIPSSVSVKEETDVREAIRQGMLWMDVNPPNEFPFDFDRKLADNLTARQLKTVIDLTLHENADRFRHVVVEQLARIHVLGWDEFKAQLKQMDRSHGISS